MNADAHTLANFAAATAALPGKMTETRRLWLAAADASDAVSYGYATGASEQTMDAREDRAWEARNALLDHLLTEFGLTSADLKRSVL